MTEATILTKEEIKKGWSEALKTVSDYLQNISPEDFEKRETEKWSIAQNLDHLIRSTKPIVKALGTSKFALKLLGKPKGPSRSYNEIVKTYHEGLASLPIRQGQFGPPEALEMSQSEYIEFWDSVGNRLNERLEKWKETDLDKYVLPHPLLGKLTIREILFFTIYHTYHHMEAIKKIA